MPISTAHVRRLSIILGFGYLLELAAAAALLAAQPRHWLVPVTATYADAPQRVILARVDVAQGVLWVLAITAVGALLPLVPAYSRRWSAGLAAQHNYGRWLEFSFTSSIIVFLLAQLNGIRDIAALVAIYSLNSAMILFGWLQERYESPASRRGGAGLLPYIFGCIVGHHRVVRDRARIRPRDHYAHRSADHHPRHACAVHRVRRRPVAAIQTGRPLCRLPLRRARIPRLDFRDQDRVRSARRRHDC
jgi:hypothetical protein